MAEIGDIGKRILGEYGIDINNVCPLQFYGKVYDEANKIRSGLIKRLIQNIPDSLRVRA